MDKKEENHIEEVKRRVEFQNNDLALKTISEDFMSKSHLLKYSYNFSWVWTTYNSVSARTLLVFKK